jgi:hypothetical protein
MKRLGYTHFVAQGGETGSPITQAMAVQAPPELLGIHISFASARSVFHPSLAACPKIQSRASTGSRRRKRPTRGRHALSGWSRLDELQLLNHRARPAVRDDERHRVLMRGIEDCDRVGQLVT